MRVAAFRLEQRLVLGAISCGRRSCSLLRANKNDWRCTAGGSHRNQAEVTHLAPPCFSGYSLSCKTYLEDLEFVLHLGPNHRKCFRHHVARLTPPSGGSGGAAGTSWNNNSIRCLWSIIDVFWRPRDNTTNTAVAKVRSLGAYSMLCRNSRYMLGPPYSGLGGAGYHMILLQV